MAKDVESFEFKVVIAGPFGVGKTTLISNISNVPVVGTEVPTRGDEAHHKDSTTVGLEYGMLQVNSGGFDLRLLMYGTPGQSRFRFMWEIVATGADACVVLIDVADKSTWAEAAALVKYFRDEAGLAVVIGANRGVDDPDAVASLSTQLKLKESGTVIPCDVTDESSAKDLIVQAFERMLASEDPNGATHSTASLHAEVTHV